jgi:TPR repeat protein
MLLAGLGTKVDAARAIPYLEKAANAGETEAYLPLAEVWQRGTDGVPKDSIRALELCHKVLEQDNDNRIALWISAQAYKDLKVNPKKVQEYLERASELGYQKALKEILKKEK